jgi:hypothetical protein
MRFTATYYVCAMKEVLNDKDARQWKNIPFESYEESKKEFETWKRGIKACGIDYVCIKKRVSDSRVLAEGLDPKETDAYEEIEEYAFIGH